MSNWLLEFPGKDRRMPVELPSAAAKESESWPLMLVRLF